jgi:predicted NBD/HSP70 family sugar kinase
VIPLLNKFLQDVSLKNRIVKNLYQLIHQHGPISKIDILKKLDIKQTTLTRMVDELLEKKYIQESGIGKSSGGRPPILYKINPTCNYIIGVDIARIETKVMLVDLSFNQIDKATFPMSTQTHPESAFAQIAQIIQQLMRKHQFTINELLGIGVGAVGPLDRKNGLILQPESFPSPYWTNVPVLELLSKEFPTKVILENGANTAVLAEYFNNPVPYQNILYCISGAGTRCGVMSNGQLVHSKQGDASAYGHIIIDVGGRDCSCGKKGCLDSYVSFSAILKQMKIELEQGKKSAITEWTEGNTKHLTIDHVLKALRQGDSLTKEMIMKSAHYYGIGLANMVNTLHPELVILNGPLIYESPFYYEEVIDTTLRYMFTSDKHSVTFSQGTLKSDAVANGAAILVFDSFFEQRT